MTEDEAKLRWCPFAFPSSRDGTNRWTARAQISKDNDASCVGSACMAWRWEVKPVAPVAGHSVVEKDGEMFRERTVPAVLEIVGEGYCGLAGKQQ